ncbi:juvenile hormone esterase-like isoform X2 [Malaya genurostris]|uniref:juvenile hormone esterase-like isoform X2 n=1 Tax=Malaya genurostris TaxID=325434 RepID=UPI0026F40417|nr:juvenile hormone esterase-like isoform X2 [Malaya genurostris]
MTDASAERTWMGWTGVLSKPSWESHLPNHHWNPVPNDPWKGILNASIPRNACIQKNDFVPQASIEGVEDCLYLNVYRPKGIIRPLPVMVFIHGGGYIAGSAHPALFGPEKVMDAKKVILVTVQYRLGVLGFLSTEDQAAPGNFGLKDQSMALRWVQRNIREFGGATDRVTAFGQSAGGSSIQFHMMSPLSKGLFSKAILESGSALAFWNDPHKDWFALARQQAAAVDIFGAAEMNSWQLIDALRNVDAVKLVASIDKLKSWNVQPIMLYHPVIERYVDEETFLAEDPMILWKEGRYHRVPWMTGYVPNEGAGLLLYVLSNATLLQQLIENQQSLVPAFVGVSESILPQLYNGYFEGNPLNVNNSEGASRMATDAAILYPMIKGIRQHLRNRKEEPVSLYYFNFKGRYSYSSLYTGLTSNKDYGICHSDDLIYLFRQRLVFPDFPPNSPEAEMSRRLIENFIRFAYDGELNSSDDTERCCGNQTGRNKFVGLVEFTNSAGPSHVNIRYLDENNAVVSDLLEMFDWWSKLEK